MSQSNIKYDVEFLCAGTLYTVTITTPKRADAIRKGTTFIKRYLNIEYEPDLIGSSVR